MGVVFLEDATWEEIGQLVGEETVAILPTGSCEQHGLHLPFKTDSYLVSAIAARSAEKAVRLNPELSILVLPVLAIGCSMHHMDFPGSLSFTGSTYLKMVEELCVCLVRHRFKRIILLNGHGGNTDYLKVTARRVRDKQDALIAVAPYYAVAKDAINQVRESAIGGICHAGEMETACMLYLDGESVRQDKIKDEVPCLISNKLVFDLVSEGISINHNVLDISKSGAIGAATLGTKDKGAKFISVITDAVAEFIVDFCRWNLSNLAE